MKLKFDHFDLLAPIYETVIRPGRSEEFWSLLDAQVESTILDAGGGTGRVSQFLNGKVKQIVVCDTSLKMLRESKYKGGLLSICGPSEQMPFQDGMFDRIIMVDALHHVADQKQTASELWRVLKPGGHILIEEPDIFLFSVKLIAIAEKMTFMRSHFLNSLEIAALFPFKHASIEIRTNDANKWVIIRKQNPENQET
jgi:ubiquinone/menaquinone biosynthesis C-methylase UbiE